MPLTWDVNNVAVGELLSAQTRRNLAFVTQIQPLELSRISIVNITT